MTTDDFDFFSGRLLFIKITDDCLLNIKLSHHLSIFENYVYGVCLQYGRIESDLPNVGTLEGTRVPAPQAGLDIYYYILTWDKLRKVYEKIKEVVNDVQQASSIPRTFTNAFRIWKQSVDHLLAEFDTNVRNEYEHPSLEPHLAGNIMMWGNITRDGFGNITAHAGQERFATIKKEHCERMQKLRVDLIDLFLKHFSQKPLTLELTKTRDYIEENIDSMLSQLREPRGENDDADFSNLLKELLVHDVYLMKEGVPLSTSVKDKLYSAISGDKELKNT